MARIIVTGAAGFIGYHVSQHLLERGDEVVGIDRLDQYYDVNLKLARLERLKSKRGFHFLQMDLADRVAVPALFCKYPNTRVIHLAAQAGVRFSLEDPHAYVDSNLVGFVNILEACRHSNCEHLVYASSSSVYGLDSQMPFTENSAADHPVSLYGASKRANELLAHSYANLFALPVTGLRFFTAYGPWGRPDMALFLFTRAILEGRPIDVFNEGHLERDFTYIDDIVEGVVRICDLPAAPDKSWNPAEPSSSSSSAPYRLYNIGQGKPIKLLDFIEILEKCIGKKAILNLLPMQPGDVERTFADNTALRRDTGYSPCIPVEVGVRKFVDWYLDYYQVTTGNTGLCKSSI